MEPQYRHLLGTDPACVADVRRVRFRTDIGTPDTYFFIQLAAEHPEFAFVPEYLAEYRSHGETSTVAGLREELTVPLLTPLAVPPEVEPFKRALLGPFLLKAVGETLLNGDSAAARSAIHNQYYRAASRPGFSACAPRYRLVWVLQSTARRTSARPGGPAGGHGVQSEFTPFPESVR